MEDGTKGFMSFASSGRNNDLFKISFADIIENHALSGEDNVVIFGEWCGRGIMTDYAKNDAINQLDPRFIVLDIGLSKEGQGKYRFLSATAVKQIISSAKNEISSPEEIRIHSIYEFKTKCITIDFSDPKKIANVQPQLAKITCDVEKKCPVAEHLGEEGSGEGMVWRLKSDNSQLPAEISGLRFKVVGSRHVESKGDELAPANLKKISSEKEFIETVLTENRMEKVLRGIPEKYRNPSAFCQALTKDILKEEELRLAASKIPSKKVHKLIEPEASQWLENRHEK
ncbi:hypothetical protein EJP617_28940 [Erwinia sp. Ejp617]|nr:hypothetical protein EJP617_28940 [Erwinia sp. Ejp617]